MVLFQNKTIHVSKEKQQAQHHQSPKMKMIAIFILTVLSVMTADAIPRNCRGTETYRVDLFTAGDLNAHQSTWTQTIYIPRCACVEWATGYRAIGFNVHWINTWGKRICVHTSDSCYSKGTWQFVYSGRTEGTYGRELSDLTKGYVYSLEYCDK